MYVYLSFIDNDFVFENEFNILNFCTRSEMYVFLRRLKTLNHVIVIISNII